MVYTQKKSNRFNFLLAVILISLLSIIFYIRVNHVSNEAEKISMQQTLSTIRLGVQFYTLRKTIAGKSKDLWIYEDENPINMLEQPPANYVGEFSEDKQANIKPGEWYYDITNKELVYKVINIEVFTEKIQRSLEFRYQLKFVPASNRQKKSAGFADNYSLHLIKVSKKT